MSGSPGPAIERPIYPGVILGWREWELREGAELWPLHSGTDLPHTAWPTSVVESPICNSPDPSHSSPGSRCGCGYNAFYEPPRPLRSSVAKVEGLIAGAGMVRLHPDGFRCERAQILCLVRSGPRKLRRIQKSAAERYGVPLVGLRGAKRLCRALGGAWDPSDRPEMPR